MRIFRDLHSTSGYLFVHRILLPFSVLSSVFQAYTACLISYSFLQFLPIILIVFAFTFSIASISLPRSISFYRFPFLPCALGKYIEVLCLGRVSAWCRQHYTINLGTMQTEPSMLQQTVRIDLKQKSSRSPIVCCQSADKVISVPSSFIF